MEKIASRGLPSGRVKKLSGIEAFALPPGGKAWRGKHVVNRHDQGEAILGRIKGFQIKHADFLKRRILDSLDERRQIQIAAVLPLVSQDRRKQNVFAALDRIGIQLQQTQEAGRRRLDPVGNRLGILGLSALRKRPER